MAAIVSAQRFRLAAHNGRSPADFMSAQTSRCFIRSIYAKDGSRKLIDGR
ncbi:MAG: hypothetical protein R3D30_10815 [Hyphomicrobiales bacterium]